MRLGPIKPGAAVKLTQYKREGCKRSPTMVFMHIEVKSRTDTDFTRSAGEPTWNVVRLFRYCSHRSSSLSSEPKIRSEFDEILLRHAEESGTKVFHETKVLSFEFTGSRPTSATYAHVSGKKGTIEFDFLVDA